VEAFYQYRREQFLGERPGCSSRRRKNGNSDDGSDPLRSVQVETLGLILSGACTNRALASGPLCRKLKGNVLCYQERR
jgi:hypothetical protein